MSSDHVKQEILRKIREVAATNGGRAPGIERFEGETGIKRHIWQGKIWRKWSDAVAEAGLAPNELQGSLSNDELLQPVLEISKSLNRFPTTTDLRFELHQRVGSPNYKTVLDRWSMSELAAAMGEYAERVGEPVVAAHARAYVPPRRKAENDGMVKPRLPWGMSTCSDTALIIKLASQPH